MGEVLKLSEKKQLEYGIVFHWLGAKLFFSPVLCVRGSRATKHQLNNVVNGAEINAIGKID